MLLKKLIRNCPKEFGLINIKNLSSDSRETKKGDLFFALKGKNFDGEKFIDDAINKGAKAVVCSKKNKKRYKIPLIKTNNINQQLVYACKIFFNKKPKNIVAVTGTNGKSSVADFFCQILDLNKVPVGSIGTLGIKTGKKFKKSKLTSPDIISLHRQLSFFKKLKINNVIIEASSHGLHQGRLDGLNIKIAIFTNFSQDHLDYHKNMKHYLRSKLILISKLLDKNKTVISDSSLPIFRKITKVTKKRNQKIIDINNYKIFNENINTNLIGGFQKKNLLMSLIASEVCGLKKTQIIKATKKIKNVEGRLELIKILPNKTKIFVDYAHTPDALSTVLKSLFEKYKKKITLVFGCGGDRDKSKRKLMSKVASKFCDKMFITDDNPRFENPRKIRNEIIKNVKIKNYKEVGNRKKAIKTAIQSCEHNEIILIAGKGHENTQDYGNFILNFSDKSIVKKINFLGKKKNKNYDQVFNSKILEELKLPKNIYFKGVSIDSKNVKKNNLFIAIKGKYKDGHDFVNEALSNNLNYAVISKSKKLYKKSYRKKIIRCPNTFSFLNNLALKKRDKTLAKIIGITGSAGKTSLKTMLGDILKCYGKTQFSPKSYNNNFGVPLSLANLEIDHNFGVFEIGMSKKGEIDRLSKIVKPEIGVITNIAEAHIENFKNIKGIAEAKSEIINNIKKNGFLIINRDNRFYKFLLRKAKKNKIKTISFGISKLSDIYPVKIINKKNIKTIDLKIFEQRHTFKIKNINTMNFLATISVLKALNLDFSTIMKKLINIGPPEGRGKLYTINRFKTQFKLLDDSYNANPLSVKNAIHNFSNLRKNNFKKYLLLGEMLELGSRSDFYHKDLSKVINNSDIDKLFVFGNMTLNTYKHTLKKKRGNVLQNLDDFDDVFRNIIKKNDYLLLKGSNATGLNFLAKQLIKGKNVI